MDRRQPNRRFWRTRNQLKKATAKVSFANTLEMLEARQLLAADVVISEIMFHPSSGDDGQEYVELFNRGDAAATLTNWRFDKGVDYTFSGGTLNPGSFLVVAADVAKFQAKYPGVANVVGGWTGTLSNGGEQIELIDNLGATVDQVTYADDGNWGTRERGRGVELVGGITASGTTATVSLFDHGYTTGDTVQIFGASQSEYNGTFVITGTTNTSFTYEMASAPAVTTATGFILSRHLIDHGNSGWAWVSFADGLGKSLELINPTLSNNDGQNWGASNTLQGTPGTTNSLNSANIAPLITEVSQTPLVPKSSEPVFISAQLKDENPAGLTANIRWRADTTNGGSFNTAAMHDDGLNGDALAGDGVWTGSILALNTGTVVEYYISAGDGINTRTYSAQALIPAVQSLDRSGNVVTATTAMPHGILPGDTITISGATAGFNGTFIVASVPDGSTFTYNQTAANASAANTGTVKAQSANRLYQVDNTTYSGPQMYFKVTMRASERATLDALQHNGTLSGSNATMNATVIASGPDGMEGRFNVGIRNRGGGSRTTSGTTTAPGYHIDFQNDHTWNGVSAVNFNGSYSMEDVAGSAVMRAAGLPVQNVVPVQVRVNNVNLAAASPGAFGSYAWLEAEDSDMVHDHFPLDDNGNYYRAVDPGHAATLAYLGTDPASYLHLYHLQTNKDNANYNDIINLTKAFNTTQTPDANFVSAVNANINVQEWMRYLAASILIGDQETTLASGVGDDYDLYRGVNDSRFLVIPHDLDTIMGQGNGGQAYDGIFQAANLASMGRLLRNATFAPMYAAAMKELADGAFSAPNIGALLQNTLGSYVPQTTIDAMKTFVANRITSIFAPTSGSPLIPLKLAVTSNTGTLTNGYPQVITPNVDLTGFSNAIKTRSVLVNGIAATWTPSLTGSPSTTSGMGTWTATVNGLRPGINRILIQARDENGAEFDRTYQDIWYDDATMVTVSGALAAGTTTWVAANGPYHVTANVTVPAGSTLVIQPGTTVFFDAGTGLTVAAGGTLLANGTDLARIRFTKTPGAASAWRDITVQSAGSPNTNSISFADMEFAGSAGGNIIVTNGRLDTDHMTWTGTTTQIVHYDNSSFRLTNSVLPTVVNVEPAHFTTMPAGGYALVQGNIFGTTTGHNDIFDFTGGNRPGSIFQVLDNVFLGTGTGFVNADDILDIDGTDAHIEGNLFMNVFPSPISDTNSAISGGADSGNTSEVVSVRNIFYNVDHAFLMKEGNSVRSVNDTMVHVLTGVYNFNEPGFAASAGVGGYGDGIIMQDVPLDASGNAIVVQNQGTSPFVLRNSVMPGNTAYTGTGNVVGDSQMIIRNTATHPVSAITRNGSIATATSVGHGFIVGDRVLVYGAGPAEYDGIFTVTNATEDTFSYVVSGTPANVTGSFNALRQPDISEFALRPGPGPAVGKGPNGVDMGASIPTGATIGGVPLSPTRSTSATITVGGPDITAYRWKLDNGAFTEVLVTNPLTTNPTIPPIVLNGLTNGTHTIYVARKNSAGFYQTDAQATTKTWIVNTALPAPTIRINEVLAQNTAAANHSGTFPDMIEIFNPGTSSVDLSGMSLTDDPLSPRKYIFPAGTPLLAPNSYLVVYADNPNATAGIHTGFSLKQSGEGVYLYNTLANGGTQIDGVTFGAQIEDLSISRQADGSWRLSTPSFGAAPSFPGAANTALPLGDPHQLKINEWGTHGVPPFSQDFVELYNSTSWPIDLGGLSLSDQPIGNPAKSVVPALSFIPAKGYFHFKADGDPEQGADHLNFHLSSERGDIGLFDAAGKQIDFIVYNTQQLGLSQGRTPDGGPLWQFFSPPNPGVANPAPSAIPTTSVQLFNYNSSWRYNQSNVSLGTAWRNKVYDDTSSGAGDPGWASGNGALGFDPDLPAGTFATPLSLGPTIRTPTFYFRIHFNLAVDPSLVQSLQLETLLDDGAAVWLNGNPALSIGVPFDSPFSFYTGSGRNVNNAAKEGPFSLNLAGLVQGDNVLAVEVHQTSNNSGDVAWDGKLSAIVQGSVTPPPPLRITEMNYHPLGGGATFSPNDYEFIELKNTGATSMNLAGIHFGAGVTFNFTSGSLAAGATGVLVKNAAAFASRYGSGINILGTYTDSLDDNGEEIRLLAADNSTIQDFAYSDSWYKSTDGAGNTLTIVDPAADPTTWIDPASWRASKFAFGSPGTTTEIAQAVDSVVVNELAINSAPGSDWIEIYNPSASPVNIGGWYLTDSAENLLKYRIPAGTTINPGQYLSFDESQFNTPSPIAFTLNDYGDDVWLSSSTTAGILTGYHQGVIVGPAENGVTFGRYTTSTGVDFPPLATPTRNAANSQPKNGPIVINEVMYHPNTTDGEFIELRNVSGSPVALDNWKFLDGLEFTFPAGTTLGAGQLLLLVDQDPNTFRTTYSVPGSVQIFQYVGSLDNAGENLALGKPGPADQVSGFIPYYLVDRVNYGTTPPWPISPDGQGPSLTRVDALAYGNDPINWQASSQVGGTPGRSNSGAGDAVVEGTAGDDTYYIRRNGSNLEVFVGTGPTGSPAFTFSADSASFTFNGNGGNDRLIVDFGNGAPLISGAINYTGGAQTTSDTLTVIGGAGANNTGSYLPTAGINGAGTITVGGHPISFTGLEPVLVNTFATFTLTTPASNDSLTLDSPVGGQTRISGTSGGVGFESISFTNVANFILDAGANDAAAPNDGITINNGTSATGLSALQIKLGAGANTINHNGGTSSLDISTTGAGTSTINVNNSSTVNFTASQRLTTLSVGSTATARLAANGSRFLRVTNLTVAATAALDLTNNDLIVQANGGNRDLIYSTVSGYLFTGRAGGAWNGRRINSSTAAADSARNTGLGAILNDSGDGVTPILTSLNGEPVDANTILVKYTWNGDANIDGIINADDYALIDAGFASQNVGYYNGDFNYSGNSPNSDDYFLIDKAFSGQTGPLSAAEITPQPASSTDTSASDTSSSDSTITDAPATSAAGSETVSALDPAPITGASSAASAPAPTDATAQAAAATSDSENTKKSRRHRHHRSPDREFAAEKKSTDRWVMPSTFSRR